MSYFQPEIHRAFQNLGLESPNTPNERGFDYFHGFLGDMMDSYTTHLRHGNNYMRCNAEVIQPRGHATDFLNFDLFPTFLELAGAMPAADLDAVSLVPLLSGKMINTPRDLYFVRREGGPAYGGKSYEAIIRGDWKLMQNAPFSPLELYNLADAPHEQHNQATTNKRIFNELSTALRDHIERGGATPWQKPERLSSGSSD